MKLKQAFRESITLLRNIYDEREAQSIVSLVFEDIGYRNTDIYRFPDRKLPYVKEKRLNDLLEKLCENMPVQYALGYAYFLGRKFRVSPDCLIPRPETEELVRVIINREKSVRRILDIGTGSGIIAISLKIAYTDARVMALDKYTEALKIARKNAEDNNTSIEFIEGDILSPDFSNLIPGIDLIVSNPPYVRESEKSGMDKNVLDYEPVNALFVKNSDPLIFYRAIRRFGDRNLKAGGKIYLEINESLGEQTVRIFAGSNYAQPIIIKDIHGKDRFIKAEKNE